MTESNLRLAIAAAFGESHIDAEYPVFTCAVDARVLCQIWTSILFTPQDRSLAQCRQPLGIEVSRETTDGTASSTSIWSDSQARCKHDHNAGGRSAGIEAAIYLDCVAHNHALGARQPPQHLLQRRAIAPLAVLCTNHTQYFTAHIVRLLNSPSFIRAPGTSCVSSTLLGRPA